MPASATTKLPLCSITLAGIGNSGSVDSARATAGIVNDRTMAATMVRMCKTPSSGVRSTIYREKAVRRQSRGSLGDSDDSSGADRWKRRRRRRQEPPPPGGSEGEIDRREELAPVLVDAARQPLGIGISVILAVGEVRSAERRVGKECVSPCRSRWSPYH